MIEHMVWFKFKDGVNREKIQQHMDGLASMVGKVPQIRELAVGENVTDRTPPGYTHGLLVRLESREALEAYEVHPEHLKVARPLKEDAEVLAMDIEHSGT